MQEVKRPHSSVRCCIVGVARSGFKLIIAGKEEASPITQKGPDFVSNFFLSALDTHAEPDDLRKNSFGSAGSGVF